MDEISEMRGTFSEQYQHYLAEVENKWQAEEKILADEHPRQIQTLIIQNYLKLIDQGSSLPANVSAARSLFMLRCRL